MAVRADPDVDMIDDMTTTSSPSVSLQDRGRATVGGALANCAAHDELNLGGLIDSCVPNVTDLISRPIRTVGGSYSAPNLSQALPCELGCLRSLSFLNAATHSNAPTPKPLRLNGAYR